MDTSLTLSNVILDSLSDGVYVCDRDRKIVYWSKSAERITGWTSQDVVGRRCLDDVLCHIDKDGPPVVRGRILPAASVDGDRRAQCSTTDRFRQGQVRATHPDASDRFSYPQPERRRHWWRRNVPRYVGGHWRIWTAKRIQTLSLEQDLPEDSRIRFTTAYMPHDIVGGDYYALRQLSSNQYGFLLADVMGHGVAAALYTMHLSSLWGRFHQRLTHPADFAATVNNELAKVVKDESFATATCGVIDAESRTIRFVSAGGPPILVVHQSREFEQLESCGAPFGMMSDMEYDEVETQLRRGDRLLLFSDGAFEIHNSENELLGIEGLVRILQGSGYPDTGIQMAILEEELLKFSNAIRLDDDVTFIEVCFVGS